MRIKSRFSSIWEAVEAADEGDFAGEFLPQGNHRDGRPADNRLSVGLAGILVAKFGNDIQIKGDFTKATWRISKYG